MEMDIPQKLKIKLPYDLAIWLLGIYLKKCKSGYNKGTCLSVFIAALFRIAKVQETTKKMWYLYTIAFYFIIKKNGILLLTGKWLELQTSS
jgi:hypothetical protein